jgi:hypothetical protein
VDDVGSRARRTSVPDLDTLRADPACVDELDAGVLLDVLDQCSEERDRLAVVERHLRARLRRERKVLALGGDDFPKDEDACVDDGQAGRFLKYQRVRAVPLMSFWSGLSATVGPLAAAKASTWVGLMAFNGHALRPEVYAPADRRQASADP